MKKRFLFLVFILLAFVLVACGAEQGAGKFSLKVYDFEGAEVYSKEYKFKEDDSLEAILKADKDLKMKGDTSEFGFFITELFGIASSDDDHTFWNLKIDGEDSMVGVRGVVLEDGMAIGFYLISWD